MVVSPIPAATAISSVNMIELDLRDIDGIRKRFTASLTDMSDLIGFLRKRRSL
ncbi:hypothetical protein [Enterocloster citroniae]|uniref:Uncharacterized protein n=1 Tax=Enterocloster citroniae TaxID=358743 RepID=A0ABV2G4J6_9FIRM